MLNKSLLICFLISACGHSYAFSESAEKCQKESLKVIVDNINNKKDVKIKEIALDENNEIVKKIKENKNVVTYVHNYVAYLFLINKNKVEQDVLVSSGKFREKNKWNLWSLDTKVSILNKNCTEKESVKKDLKSKSEKNIDLKNIEITSEKNKKVESLSKNIGELPILEEKAINQETAINVKKEIKNKPAVVKNNQDSERINDDFLPKVSPKINHKLKNSKQKNDFSYLEKSINEIKNKNGKHINELNPEIRLCIFDRINKQMNKKYPNQDIIDIINDDKGLKYFNAIIKPISNYCLNTIDND